MQNNFTPSQIRTEENIISPFQMQQNFTRKFWLQNFIYIKDSNCRSSSYEDELIWAAAWLYKATEDSSYLTLAESKYSSRSPGVPWAFDWDDKTAGAQLLLYQLTNKASYKADVEAFCDAADAIQKSPGGQTFRLQWGSNRYASNFAFICLAVRALHLVLL